MLKTTTLRRPEVEKDVELRLIKRCKEHGWYCRKFVSPGHRGVPDRIVGIKASGPRRAKVWFIELKKPGEGLRPLQKAEHDEMLEQGMDVIVLSSRDEVDVWCAQMAEAANA